MCVCHGEPCYWQKDARMKAGGSWECRVKRRAYNATRTTNPERRAALTQRRRDRYDSDPFFRIGGALLARRAKALRLLKRRKAALKEG